MASLLDQEGCRALGGPTAGACKREGSERRRAIGTVLRAEFAHGEGDPAFPMGLENRLCDGILEKITTRGRGESGGERCGTPFMVPGHPVRVSKRVSRFSWQRGGPGPSPDRGGVRVLP
jgi:hypothetical protein